MEKLYLQGGLQKAESSDSDFIKIRGYANTSSVDRHGDRIPSKAWTKKVTSSFLKSNPIILFNHDHNQPIGKATKAEQREDGLYIEAEISKLWSNSHLLNEGVLKTMSVGFIPEKMSYLEDEGIFEIKKISELLEISVVSIPANSGSTFSVSKSLEERKELKEKYKEKKDMTNLFNAIGKFFGKEIKTEEEAIQAFEDVNIESIIEEKVKGLEAQSIDETVIDAKISSAIEVAKKAIKDDLGGLIKDLESQAKEDSTMIESLGKSVEKLEEEKNELSKELADAKLKASGQQAPESGTDTNIHSPNSSTKSFEEAFNKAMKEEKESK